MNLPDALTSLPQWVAYRIEINADGKPTKVPYRADGRGKASSTDPATWCDFKTALRGVIQQGFNGPGFVFTKTSGIVGIDLDHCLDALTGELAEWAQDIVTRLNSYTELSPSGTGLHIYVKGTLPEDAKHTKPMPDGGKIEIYDSARYFTVTAQPYAGTPALICERTDAMAALHAELFPPKPAAPRAVVPTHILPDDSELLNKARSAKNGSEFAALFDSGDTSGYGGDDSRADLALAGHLLFWAGGDCERAERLFGQSALGQRDKWRDREDYRQRTFQKAAEDMKDFYTPGGFADMQANRANSQNRESHTHNSQNTKKSAENDNSVNCVYQKPENENFQWEPITPIGMKSLPPFPTDALPDWLRAYVEALAAATETPPDLAGLLALSLCGLCVAKTARVALSPDWTEPLNLFTLTVMPSGSRKSAVFARMTAPITRFEIEENKIREPEVALARHRYDQLTARYKDAAAQAVKAKDTLMRQEAEQEAEALTAEIASFSMPSLLRLVTSDFTQERLIGLLAEQGERLGVMAPEGGIFETLAGHYTGGSVNIDIILSGQSGDAYHYDRKNSPSIVLKKPALTMGLAVQPDVLRGMIGKPGFKGRGLLARYLYALPHHNIGYCHNRDISVPPILEQTYCERIGRMLSHSLEFMKQEDAMPPLLYMEPDARSLFQEWRNTIETQRRPGERLGDMEEWSGKIRGQAARVSAILHIAETGRAEGRIALHTVEAAIRLGEYFIPHAIAAFGEMRTDDATDKARAVVEWIQRKSMRTFTRRDVHVAHRSRFQTATDVDPILILLAKQNYIMECPAQKRVGAGQPASPVYEVNPGVFHTQNTQNTDESSHSVYSVYENAENENLKKVVPLLTGLPSQEAFARIVAASRKTGNDATRKPEADRGSEQRNAAGDYDGAFGEVLAVQFLETQGLPVKDWLPLEAKPVPRPDITLYDAPIEIKTSSPEAKSFCINEKQRVKFAAIPGLLYWPVVRIGEKQAQLCKPIPAAEVATWQLLTPEDNPKVSSPCRSIPFDCLEQLQSLAELLPAGEGTPETEGEAWETY